VGERMLVNTAEFQCWQSVHPPSPLYLSNFTFFYILLIQRVFRPLSLNQRAILGTHILYQYPPSVLAFGSSMTAECFQANCFQALCLQAKCFRAKRFQANHRNVHILGNRMAYHVHTAACSAPDFQDKWRELRSHLHSALWTAFFEPRHVAPVKDSYGHMRRPQNSILSVSWMVNDQ
jgi:hypothetical protein